MPFMYILKCANGSYYTGSTKDLQKRLWEHQNGFGANHTKKYNPVKLVYFEEYNRVDDAFYREKQVQGWTHAKKKALIEKNPLQIHDLAECKNETSYKNVPFDSAQGTPQRTALKTHRKLAQVLEQENK